MRAALALCLALGAGSAFAQDTAPAPQPPDAAPAVAEAPAEVRALYEALRLPGIVDVMAAEGQAYADELAAGLFGGRAPPASWDAAVDAIYDPALLGSEVLATLAEGLEGEDVAAMRAFFEGEPGATIASLELSAREALLDDDVEQAAKEAAAVAVADDDPRLDLLRRYAEANDLIETNVAGALNSNLSYYAGLMDGGAIEPGVDLSEIVADVQSQEPQVRADTTEWIYAFLLMAYAPATDADIETLIAFSETDAGQALNAAMFAAFDGVFDDVSRALGRAAARVLTTQDI